MWFGWEKNKLLNKNAFILLLLLNVFIIPYIIYCYLNCIIIIIIIIIYILHITVCTYLIFDNIFVTLDHKTSHKGHFF